MLYFFCFGTLEREITSGIGAESLGRHSFEKPEMTPLNEFDEQGDELQDQAIMVNLDSSVEEPAEDEAEQPASQGKESAQHFC